MAGSAGLDDVKDLRMMSVKDDGTPGIPREKMTHLSRYAAQCSNLDYS